MYQFPIIDRAVFFDSPEISAAQISPDGQYISFIKPLNGIQNIWLKKKRDDFCVSYPITSVFDLPITNYFWSRDSKFVLYIKDNGGDENFHIYAVSVEAARQGHIPVTKDLTPYSQIRAVMLRTCRTDHTKLFVGINDRDPAWHDLYRLDIQTGERELVLKNDKYYSDFFFDQDDQLRMVLRILPDGGTELLKRTVSGWMRCYLSGYEDSTSVLNINNNEVYLASNKGSRNLMSLVLLNLNTDTETELETDPLKEVDLSNIFYSEVQNEILATIYISTKKRIYWKDKNYQNDYRYVCNILNTEEVRFFSCTTDEREWLIHKEEDVDPGSVYYFNRNNRNLLYLYEVLPALQKEVLCKMSSVSYYSSDQLCIQAYLTLPPNNGKELLPAVILVHGGPWARDYWGYNGWVQFLANRGYVVLQPNFRGSAGYGKQFLNLGNLEWGGKIQDDITHGAKYLIEKGLVDPKRIAIMGWSFGGYAALAGLTFTSHIYACGVCIEGPSNLLTLLESTPPYWESALKMFNKRIGNPNTADGKRLLEERSPFFHAHKIHAPLLIIQGDNDPRVKKTESEQIVKLMHRQGLQIEYLNFLGEGHGFVNHKNIMAFMAVIEKFLSLHIGGRCQDTLTKELEVIIQRATINPMML